MYIWVILAVFMVTLASFHVPVRNDMADFTEVPRADAVVTSLIEQQKAAVKFVRASCQSNTDGLLEIIYRDNSPLSELQHLPNIPLDKNADSCLGRHNPRYNFNANSATSEIYCLNGECQGASSYMLITFAPIPEDWKTPEGRPDIHLRAALGRHGGEANLGWSQLGEDGATGGNFTSLVRYGRENGEIPNEITGNDSTFTNTCFTEHGNLKANPHCLVIWNEITSCTSSSAAVDIDPCGLPTNTPSACSPDNLAVCSANECTPAVGGRWYSGQCLTEDECNDDRGCQEEMQGKTSF